MYTGLTRTAPVSLCMPVHPPVTAALTYPRCRYLPSRALRTVQVFLGPTYWADRARLTTLHLQLDLVTCDVFRAWADACKWAAWRARHPELPDATKVAATAFPWARLPSRLRAEQDGRLRALKARLDDAATLGHGARTAWVRRLLDVEAVECATEAGRLRARVHG